MLCICILCIIILYYGVIFFDEIVFLCPFRKVKRMMAYPYKHLKAEKNYEFRRILEQVHTPDRRDYTVACGVNEMQITDGWTILVEKNCSKVILNVAKDLQDYLLTSMQVSVLLKIKEDLIADSEQGKYVIILVERPEALSAKNSYHLSCTQDRVVICGADPLGTAHGSYFLEDLMNMKEAPILPIQDVVRQPVMAPRMVHSGWGMDQFPDSQLRLMAHYGFDSVLVTIRGEDETATGYQDINNLIDRAAEYGLGVYLYSNIKAAVHPDEPGAEATMESIYGTMFTRYNKAKGIILVGESVEFPSRDERTTGVPLASTSAVMDDSMLPDNRPSPGWWPCRDYPEYINLLKKVIRRHCPEADIVFWTYNWGWAPEEDRVALIKSLPEDITVMVTFEMFEKLKRENITNITVDYTLSFEGPGHYFTSEAKAVKERNIPLYTMSNAAGLTWDFGVIPYEPVPFQWAKRYKALLEMNEQYGLCGTIDAHHYGWWPSVIAEQAKWTLWRPFTSTEEITEKLAVREFGREATPLVLQAWQKWSNAMPYYCSTDEDQYGPFRIGPSYPLQLQIDNIRQACTGALKLPDNKFALTGNGIFFTKYQPLEFAHQTPGFARTEVEIRSLTKMQQLWDEGTALFERAVKMMPCNKQKNGEKMLNLGCFMGNCIKTVIHVKKWYRMNMQLRLESDPQKAIDLCNALIRVAYEEMENARNTIPLVEVDSRLGWEPTMRYMTDAHHLRWKIEQVRRVAEEQLPNIIELLEASTS